jgi:hypothetical protein
MVLPLLYIPMRKVRAASLATFTWPVQPPYIKKKKKKKRLCWLCESGKQRLFDFLHQNIEQGQDHLWRVSREFVGGPPPAEIFVFSQKEVARLRAGIVCLPVRVGEAWRRHAVPMECRV